MSARSSTRTSALVAGLVLASGVALAVGARSGKRAVATLRVAAAADLGRAFEEVGAAYTKESGQKVVFTFGSTGLLEKQLAEGAPFDVFAAANVSYADDAVAAGACLADSKSLYARGRIAVWVKKGAPQPKSLRELTEPRYRKIAIANPEHAPYGRAALQALERAGLVAALKPRLVYGENVQQALQFAQSGNVEAAIVALSLAVVSDGEYLVLEESAHQPIDQAMVACGKDPERLQAARAFTAFVGSPAGRAIMRRYGFLLPGELALQTPPPR